MPTAWAALSFFIAAVARTIPTDCYLTAILITRLPLATPVVKAAQWLICPLYHILSKQVAYRVALGGHSLYAYTLCHGYKSISSSFVPSQKFPSMSAHWYPEGYSYPTFLPIYPARPQLAAQSSNQVPSRKAHATTSGSQVVPSASSSRRQGVPPQYSNSDSTRSSDIPEQSATFSSRSRPRGSAVKQSSTHSGPGQFLYQQPDLVDGVDYFKVCFSTLFSAADSHHHLARLETLFVSGGGANLKIVTQSG